MAGVKYMQIQLTDANTGEIIYTTKNSAISSSGYLRQKLNRNIDSFLNYFRDNGDRDLVLQVILREQATPLNFNFKDYDVY